MNTPSSEKNTSALIIASFFMLPALLSTGCATSSPVRVPTGRWTGHGQFFSERWGKPEKQETIHRKYPTHLRIRPTNFEGRPALSMDIDSENGGLGDGMGDRTRLRLLLVETARPSDSIILYRVAAHYDSKGDKPMEFDSNAPPVAASCIRYDKDVVLQIVYDKGFVDCFRFRGRGLTKAGTFVTDDGTIHWVESLYQVEPADLISTGTPHLSGMSTAMAR